MKLRTLLTIAGLAVIAASACADGGDGGDGGDNGGSYKNGTRTFHYTSMDSVNGDYSASGTTTFKVRTDVNVNSYLYITGNLGAAWTVSGWGKGTDTQTNTIRFYHIETLTLVCAGFGNPGKISGTRTGAQSVVLNGQFALYNDQSGNKLYDSGMVPISKLNTLFTASGPNFHVSQTSGLMRLQLGRQIVIDPTVGPGKYENIGTITVVRN